jgi:hypothetical protein
MGPEEASKEGKVVSRSALPERVPLSVAAGQGGMVCMLAECVRESGELRKPKNTFSCFFRTFPKNIPNFSTFGIFGFLIFRLFARKR